MQDSYTGLTKRGSLSYNGNTILYKTVLNSDGTISVVDISRAGSNQGNLIGVATVNSSNQLVFAENPDYFDEARD